MESPREHVPTISAGALLTGGLRAIATLHPLHVALLTLSASTTVTLVVLARRLAPAAGAIQPFDVAGTRALMEDSDALVRVLAFAGLSVVLLTLLYAVAVACLVSSTGRDRPAFSRGVLRCAAAALLASLGTCIAYLCLVLPAFFALSSHCLAAPLAARHRYAPLLALEESAARMESNKGAYVLFRVILLVTHGAVHLVLKRLWETSIAAPAAHFGDAIFQASWFAMITPPLLVHILLVAGADTHLEAEQSAARAMARAAEVFA